MDGILVLEDGHFFRGKRFGGDFALSGAPGAGEVVFNTSLTGYQEILTDPSYEGQIVTLTYPHIGNTGTNTEDEESTGIFASGLVIRDLPLMVSNWRSEQSLDAYLKARKVVGIAGIDTRKPNSSGADYIILWMNLLFRMLGELFGIASAENKQVVGNLLNATNGSLMNLTSVAVSGGNIQSVPDADTVYKLYSATELRGQNGCLKLDDIIKLIVDRGGGDGERLMFTTIVEEQGSNKRETKKFQQVYNLSLIALCTNCKPDKLTNEQWRTLLAVWTTMCPGSGPYMHKSEVLEVNDMETNQFQARMGEMSRAANLEFMSFFMVPLIMARAYVGIFNKIGYYEMAVSPCTLILSDFLRSMISYHTTSMMNKHLQVLPARFALLWDLN